MLNESTRQMEIRLDREGRLTEFRDRFKELKENGLSGKEAWAQAKEEYSPPQCNDRAEFELVDSALFADKAPVDSATNVRWVAANLALAKVQPESAPSAEAWSLFAWTRRHPENQDAFWRHIYRPVIRPHARTGDSDCDEAADEAMRRRLEMEKMSAI